VSKYNRLQKFKYGFDRVTDLTGQVSGKLTVLRRVERPEGSTDTSAHWLCKCTCGRERIVSRKKMRSGANIGCGCGRNAPIHGKAGSAEYKCWVDMLQRCLNHKNSSYANYGGRGIKVAESWFKFEDFYADMGDLPGPGYTIERVDVNGNYEPGNCIWLPKALQAHNKRNTVLTVDLVRNLRRAKKNGEKVRSWARRHGISETACYQASLKQSWAKIDV